MGQIACFFETKKVGRQHRAHGTWIDPAIAVAANCTVDRAVVHAGAATDAAQHFAEPTCQHLGTAVVHQHHVVLLRSVCITGTARPGAEGGVAGDLLAGGAARQQTQQGARIV